MPVSLNRSAGPYQGAQADAPAASFTAREPWRGCALAGAAALVYAVAGVGYPRAGMTMDIAGALSEPLKPLVPGWSVERVEAVSNSLGEAVLWQGSGYLDGTVGEAMRHVGVAYGMATVCFAATVLLLYLSKGSRRFARNVGVAAAFVLGLGAGMLVASGTAYLGIARNAAPTYLVTRTRLVVLTGTDGREDVPASSVEAVASEGGGVRIRLSDGRWMRVPAHGGRRDALEPAIREMAGTRT